MPRNTLTDAIDRRWYGVGQHEWQRIVNDLNDGRVFNLESAVRSLLASEFSAGARWNMSETTRLNPYVSQFIEMLILLGVFDGEIEMVPTTGDASSVTTAGERAPGNQNGIGDG